MQDNGGEHDPAQVDDAAGREMPSAQPTPAQSPGSPEGPARPAESPERPPESAADKAAQAPQPQTQTQTQTQAQPQTRCSRRRRLALGIGAAGTAAVVAFAAFAAVGGLSGPAQASSAIPSPPRQNKTFVEDDDGTGADSQANILQSAAPGLVHVVTPDGTPAGTGVILTPSGLVLTTRQALQGARRVTVRVVLSGRSFPARLVGADPAHDLGLLQILGGPAFRPIAVGNSRYLGRGDAVTAVGSAGLTKTFTLDIGNLTSGAGAVANGGQRLTGLLVSTARVVAGEETGGPLVDLSGQAVGIDVAGTGSGLQHSGFAVPINEALAVAKRIQAAHSR